MGQEWMVCGYIGVRKWSSGQRRIACGFIRVATDDTQCCCFCWSKRNAYSKISTAVVLLSILVSILRPLRMWEPAHADSVGLEASLSGCRA